MNLKLNNDVRNPGNMKSKALTIKEERQRTGRYIAILVGILLFLLAIYHAWVRRIPFIASLVVPAIIMFIYVGWVLYTASRDKHRALDAEAALAAELAAEEAENLAAADPDLSNESQKTPEDNLRKDLVKISAVTTKGNLEESPVIVKPIILVNDEPPDDAEYIYAQIGSKDILANNKIKTLPMSRRFKRRFCRSKRHAAFKRSYSIA